ncbi:SH3 domain-containing protein [Streptomyces anandii]|uniref:SH3 domain-containing protein n=1 Tax=Streptomyces anandii TaxID=285454 RepID=UPI0016791F9B|nr:SH3 domain-containing protein [Streptomyces anandii]
MIRRTLTSGLLATVAVLALVPAADAAPAVPASRPAASALAPQLPPALLPAPAHVRYTPHVNRRMTHRRSTPVLGRVTTHRFPLNVRSGPGYAHRVIGVRHAGRLIAVQCRTYGSWVRGDRQWYRLAYIRGHLRGYVSARYVRVRRTVPWC